MQPILPLIRYAFSSSFDCMRIGDKGVKIVRPDDPEFQQQPGIDAEVDAGGYDDVEDYDENAVVRRRRRRRRKSTQKDSSMRST